MRDFVADRLELNFKDQYVSRRDMFQLAQFLHTKCIYMNDNFEFEGVRVKIRGIFRKKKLSLEKNAFQEVQSAVIDKT